MQSHSHFRSFSLRRLVSAGLIAACGVAPVLPAWGHETLIASDSMILSVSMLPAYQLSVAPSNILPAQPSHEAGAPAEMLPGATSLDDRELSQERGRMAVPMAIVTAPDLRVANSVTLWDELPSPTNPTPRPQQLSNGNNVQTVNVRYSR